MTEAAGHDLSHLPPAASRLGAAFARPKVLAVICVVALAGLGWLALGLHVRRHGRVRSAVPAARRVGRRLGRRRLRDRRPDVGRHDARHDAAERGAHDPDLRRDRRHRRAQRRAQSSRRSCWPPATRVVWLGFAVVATLAQFAFTRVALLDTGMASASGLFSGAIFIGAGVYQFSALKHACLTQCQQPVSVLLRQLGDHAARRISARRPPGPLLPRLLLGDDAGDVRGRRDERDLDGGARHGDDDSKRSAPASVSLTSWASR